MQQVVLKCCLSDCFLITEFDYEFYDEVLWYYEKIEFLADI